VILFHLFGGKMLRFSALERTMPAISQKMLIQQLRQLERDGIVRRSSTIKCRRKWSTA
jgi:DNA-binding HxlR family transcriptional regulator